MHGYYEMPDATAAAIDADGWLHTGDLASMDDRGYCRIEGRLKDMIIRGGENIFPREIEQRLFTHPAVGDVAVVGIPDEKWGEQVCAFVRAAPGAAPRRRTSSTPTFARSSRHTRRRASGSSWRTFPMTPSGKVQKFVLRDRFVAGDLPAVSAHPARRVRGCVRPSWARTRGSRAPVAWASPRTQIQRRPVASSACGWSWNQSSRCSGNRCAARAFTSRARGPAGPR